MSRVNDRKARRKVIKGRFRERNRGTAERPRLAVYKSLRYVYAQVIDDEKGETLVSASSLEKSVRGGLSGTANRQAGETVGRTVAERAAEKGIDKVVMDRGGFRYHGVVRAVAEGAREAGLKM